MDKESKSGLDRISLRRQIGAVKRITHFQAQYVARAQSARFNSEGFASFERRIPKICGITRGKENFNAVLSGVTGPRDRNTCSVEREIDNVISRRQIDSIARSEEHTSELQSHSDLVCRLLL